MKCLSVGAVCGTYRYPCELSQVPLEGWLHENGSSSPFLHCCVLALGSQKWPAEGLLNEIGRERPPTGCWAPPGEETGQRQSWGYLQ